MIYRKLISLHLSLFGALAGCGTGAESLEPSPEDGTVESAMAGEGDESSGEVDVLRASADEQSLFAKGNSEFNSKLYAALAAESSTDNFVYSPYSIASALTQVHAGAKGSTQSQMHTALQLKLPSERALPALGAVESSIHHMTGEQPTLRISNSLWIDQSFKVNDSYINFLKKFVRPTVKRPDFIHAAEEAIADVNRLVSDATEQKITNLLSPRPGDRYIRFMLINAIYFKGLWKTPFPEKSPNAPFTTGTGEAIEVPTMTMTKDFRYVVTNEYQAVSLPFKGDRIAMTVVLPKEGRFDAVQSSLTGDATRALLAQLGPDNYGTAPMQRVDLSLPKLKLRNPAIDLKPILEGLRMTDAFDPRLADFSGISDPSVLRLFISAVKHMAVFEVDELGVVAAGATGIVMKMQAHAHRIVHTEVMNVNRPFIVFLHDHATDTTLFTARVKTLPNAAAAPRLADHSSDPKESLL